MQTLPRPCLETASDNGTVSLFSGQAEKTLQLKGHCRENMDFRKQAFGRNTLQLKGHCRATSLPMLFLEGRNTLQLKGHCRYSDNVSAWVDQQS